MINLVVRAIVPIPGSRGSTGDASNSRAILRFGPRFAATLGNGRRDVARSPDASSLEAG
jgi:hypothetical protein